MPRPTSKTELVEAADRELALLRKETASLSPEEMVEPDIVGPWSVKDVFAHLTAWHRLALGWYETGLRGESPELPAPGFKWNQTPALNEQIYQQYCDTTLEDTMDAFERSHAETMVLIDKLSNDDLFGPSKHVWTGRNTLGTYFVSTTSSHYLWARKEIRKGRKAKSGS